MGWMKGLGSGGRSGGEESVAEDRAMREVMALMDEWKAPEPTAWFDARTMARFRAEREHAPEGLFARLRDRFLFGSDVRYKPLLAGAMAMLLIAGGSGSYLEMANLRASHAGAASATVQDLQILDNNDQAIQQMDQLLDNNDDTHGQS